MFVLLTIAYISVLLYADLRGQVFHHIADIGLLVAVICAISTCSFLLRFLRWRWLLGRRGFETPLVSGCLSYFAGFALTALPGKLGELVRMRYFSLLGVPGNVVVGCFFFERLIDIGAVLLLVCLIAHAAPGFWVGSAFAATLMLVVVAHHVHEPYLELDGSRAQQARLPNSRPLRRRARLGFFADAILFQSRRNPDRFSFRPDSLWTAGTRLRVHRSKAWLRVRVARFDRNFSACNPPWSGVHGPWRNWYNRSGDCRDHAPLWCQPRGRARRRCCHAARHALVRDRTWNRRSRHSGNTAHFRGSSPRATEASELISVHECVARLSAPTGSARVSVHSLRNLVGQAAIVRCAVP